MQDNGIELYRRFLNGDERGLEELIALYQHGLLRFIYGYVQDVALAEDIFTDVFLALYYKRSFKETDGATLKTYLYKIARNKALNAIKKRKRQREVSLDALMELGAENPAKEGTPSLFYRVDNSPQNALEESERTKRVHEAMSQLKPDQREVLGLRFLEDMSPETIAKVTKRTKKQVYNLIARGKLALKEKLLEGGGTYEDL